MAGSLLSASWYRVANLRPRLRRHARFHRHLYRGQLWYVLQDRASGRCHRLTPAAYEIIGRMDGQRTTHEVWESACTRLGDDAPTQDETIRVLGLLHAADVLRCDVTPDLEEIFRRTHRRAQRDWWQRVASPLSVRFPLVDPDDFLERWLPAARPLFSRAGAVACATAVAAAILLGAVNADRIASAGPAGLLDPGMLLVVWLVYPLVKIVHELAHAFAVKVFGGEVHEMGILLLVLVPVPYVDASAASVFPDKGRRMWVGAAGVTAELVLASLALGVWLSVDPGWIRNTAYAVMWIGGASALIFNGNPLLRFDGYYVLADAIEIPNLKSRSTQYLAYLVLHRLFRLDTARNPVAAGGEPAWFVGYGVASFVYRLVVLVGIALFISQKFFILGVLLAIFAVATGVVVPVLRQLAFLLTSPRLGARRPRALAVSAGLAAAAVVVVFLLPTPVFTVTQGVVWPPERSQVRARADGFVVRLLAEPGGRVERGQPLVLTRDPALEADLAVQDGKLAEIRAELDAARRDRVRSRILADELAGIERERSRAHERVGDVVVKSPAAGRFVVARPTDLPGRLVAQGEAIGWVVGGSETTARVVVRQADADLVRHRTRGVSIRLASRLGDVLEARVQREVPAASERLPTPALGPAGGGPFAVDPSDDSGLRTREKVFQFELSLPDRVGEREIGARVHARFEHGFESLASRALRSLRGLFLGRIGE